MTGSSVVDVTYRRLAEEIRRGVFQPASRLPGERELAVRLGVSRSTLRQALSDLAQEGLIGASAQRGWYVHRQTIGEPPSTLQSFTEMAAARGLRPDTRVLEECVRPATLDEAEKLGIAPAAPVLHVERVRGMEGVPVCVDTVVLVHARVEGLDDVDLNDSSLYAALEERCGVTVSRSAYSVQAVAADERLAGLLQVEVGSPVLVGREIAYTADGVPLLVGVNHYRGDAYRFEADLYRPLGERPS